MKLKKMEITSLNPEELQALIEEALETKVKETIIELQKSSDEEVFLSRQEVAKLLDVDLTTIWRYCNNGKLSVYSIAGTKRVYFKKSEVLASLVKVNEL